MSRKKGYIEDLCDYVLSQDHERHDLINELAQDFSQELVTKQEAYACRENRIYYKACVLRYGKREANKMFRECIEEALE